MIIRYANGKMREAIVLARTSNTMRVITTDTTDTIELQLYDGLWVDEDCEAVTLNVEQSMEPAINDEELVAALLDYLFPRTSMTSPRESYTAEPWRSRTVN